MFICHGLRVTYYGKFENTVLFCYLPQKEDLPTPSLPIYKDFFYIISLSVCIQLTEATV